MTQARPVTVYAESTPNPEAMKFVANFMLIQKGVAEYENAEDASDSPLARQLFGFTGVKGVFISSNFITVTKLPDTDWYDIVNILREFIRGYLATGDPIFIGEREPSETGTAQEEKPEVPVNGDDIPIEQKIQVMLNDYVRPAVEQDGGAIHFKSFNDGVVTVELKGSCSGCPSSTVTLKSGIENLLTRMLPEVKEVVAEQG